MLDLQPVYLETYAAEPGLHGRIERGLELLESCTVCPRDCGVNRLKDQTAVCHSGRFSFVSSHFAHFGEEDCLRGWNGSGTIFFSSCNLKCRFCQNHSISQARNGEEVSPPRLAGMMLELQSAGCHNINFVTPEHALPQVLEALPHAIEGGLRVPLVYNTSGYDSLEGLKLMDGLVDIYMPDLKFWDSEISRRMMLAPDYPAVVRESILEMHRQVGDLVFDGEGLAVRGLLVRHLVMPNRLAGTQDAMRWLHDDVSPETFINIMDQYRPEYKAFKYEEINRPTSRPEWEQAVRIARAAGLTRIDERHPHPRLLTKMIAGRV